MRMIRSLARQKCGEIPPKMALQARAAIKKDRQVSNADDPAEQISALF
jgi:hypothetical protein